MSARPSRSRVALLVDAPNLSREARERIYGEHFRQGFELARVSAIYQSMTGEPLARNMPSPAAARVLRMIESVAGEWSDLSESGRASIAQVLRDEVRASRQPSNVVAIRERVYVRVQPPTPHRVPAELPPEYFALMACGDFVEANALLAKLSAE